MHIFFFYYVIYIMHQLLQIQKKYKFVNLINFLRGTKFGWYSQKKKTVFILAFLCYFFLGFLFFLKGWGFFLHQLMAQKAFCPKLCTEITKNHASAIYTWMFAETLEVLENKIFVSIWDKQAHLNIHILAKNSKKMRSRGGLSLLLREFSKSAVFFTFFQERMGDVLVILEVSIRSKMFLMIII